MRRLVNLGDQAVTVPLRMGVTPLRSAHAAGDKGSDGSFQIQAGEDKDAGPQALFTVQPDTPRGSYALTCVLTDPFTGEQLARDDSPFVVQ